MGNTPFGKQQTPVPRTVTFLPNSISEDPKYKAIDCESIRFCDITAYKSQRNQYIFTMKMRNEIDIRECVPVLNEMVHCIAYQNYELKIEPRMLVDIFDKKFSSTLINVKNEKNLSEYSMKIIPFTSYNSIQFKKALYQLYINRQLGVQSPTVKLLDYYIYGLSPDQQAFVFLFEKCITSLANIAQYRKQANMPWTNKQKIKIIYEVLQSYQSLYNRNIVHRDLRPSNIFFVPSSNKFVIGNFSRARLLRRNYEHDLMSVCGVPDFSCNEMQMLMLQGHQIGYYQGMKQDCYGLKSILNIIQTCQIYDNNPVFKQPEIGKIANLLNIYAEPRVIVTEIQKLVASTKTDLQTDNGDRNIAESCSYLLAHTHKALIQQHMFDAYGYLGYHKDYSDTAHKMLQKNNANNREYENAPILRNLGDFYESKGTKGTQYYYNAFVLYILRADNQIRYGFPDKAQTELENAKQIYFKFNKVIESELPRIQINRVAALIMLQENDMKNSINTINDTFIKAAHNNIPVEKQCKILLAYGRIYRKMPETRPQALKKLSTGLTICENSGVFDSPASCRIYKSKFLKEIGKLYVDDVELKIDPRKKQHDQSEIQLRAQAQTYLRSALQIQERQNVDDLQVADTLENLGKFYYLQQNFYDAKRYYDTAKIRYAHMKQFINPMRQLNVLYMRGSCCYYLKQLNDAKMDYQTCLARLETLPKTQQNQILSYNIQGNLGIVLLLMGNPDGRAVIEGALSQIKQLKGEKSYDYVAMYQHYLNTANKMNG